LEQSFTAHMPLLTAAGAFQLQRRCTLEFSSTVLPAPSLYHLSISTEKYHQTVVPRVLCLLHLFIIYQNIIPSRLCHPTNALQIIWDIMQRRLKCAMRISSLRYMDYGISTVLTFWPYRQRLELLQLNPLQDQYSNSLSLPIQFPPEIPLWGISPGWEPVI